MASSIHTRTWILLQDMLNHARYDEYDLSSLSRNNQWTDRQQRAHDAGTPEDTRHDQPLWETECFAPVLGTNIADPVAKKIGRIGQPLPHTEVKIVDVNNIVVPIGTIGEIYVRGTGVMLCYYNDAEKTREVIDEGGWYHFKDLAIMDEEGYVNVVGRADDVIKRAAITIYPQEVENTIMEHPAIDKVIAVGVPDARLFQEICACVELKEGAVWSMMELEPWCREQFCPEKTLDGLGLMPRYVLEFNPFPLTAVGKFDRREMTKVAIERIRLGQE